MLKMCRVWPVLACSLAGFVITSRSATFLEDFAANPTPQNWRVFGEGTLFQWNATNQVLDVTWDSSRSNSYFYRSLRTILSKEDDFIFGFDLRLRDITAGVDPEKPFTFQIAVGLLNWAQATRSNFYRGSGMDSPNLVEFDYFPDTGYGATLSPVIISSNHLYSYCWGYNELTPAELFRIQMEYTASNQTLVTSVTRDGAAYAIIRTNLDTSFSDFRVDTLSISSFSDAGQDPIWGGSILAHGSIDNVFIQTPLTAIQQVTGQVAGAVYALQFASQTNFIYHMEATKDLKTWTNLVSQAGSGGLLTLQATNAAPAQFYRVRVERP